MRQTDKKARDLDPDPKEKALDWFVRLSVGKKTVVQKKLDQACASDPQLADEIEKLNRVQSMVRRLDPSKAHELLYEDNAFDAFASPPKRKRFPILYSIGLAAMVVLGLSVFVYRHMERDIEMDVIATDMEPYTRRLKDGSIVRLNKLSQIQSQFSATDRLVHLVDGEAYFSIKSDASRPFRVMVDGICIKAVGTAFNVQKRQNQIGVTVTEGVIQIDQKGEAERDTADPESVRLVRSGHQVEFELGQAQSIKRIVTSAVSAEDLDDLQSWRNPLLTLQGDTLSQIAESFEQKTGYTLIIHDPNLGRFRIAGSFPSDDVIGFLTVLENAYGIPWRQRNELTFELGKPVNL